MRKALIKCTGSTLRIPEKDLTLHRGQSLLLSETEFRRCTSFQKALQQGLISLEWKDTMAKNKPKKHLPPYVRRNTKQPPRVASKAPQKVSGGISKQETKEAVQEVLAEQIAELKKQLLAELSSQMDVSKLGDLLQNTVKEALSNVGSSPVVRNRKSDEVVLDDEPIFIPSDLTTSGNIQGNSVSVATEATEGASLDDAAEALRAMRKNRRKKPTGGK